MFVKREIIFDFCHKAKIDNENARFHFRSKTITYRPVRPLPKFQCIASTCNNLIISYGAAYIRLNIT